IDDDGGLRQVVEEDRRAPEDHVRRSELRGRADPAGADDVHDLRESERPEAELAPERQAAGFDLSDAVERLRRSRVGHGRGLIDPASAAAPTPLPMLPTATPGAQELSIARSAAMPPKLAPSPMLVGTATTGPLTSPPTTLASAPSIPATAMTTRARSSRARSASRRCSPATPTSYNRSTSFPMTSAETAASSAAGMSEVPAAAIRTTPSPRGTSTRRSIIRASSWNLASGTTFATSPYAASSVRVTSSA